MTDTADQAAPEALIDEAAFSLSSFDPVAITMPERQEASKVDVDAQLFEYVANAGKDAHIHGLADLDDDWARETFPGVAGVEDLRARIKRELEQEYRRAWDTLKFEKCTDALVARLVGELPAEAVDANVEAARPAYEERLRSFGQSKAQYLAKENLTEEEYDEKLRADVAYQMKLTIAMNKLVEHDHVEVAPEELTSYLSCENPDTYVEELRAGGHLENAQKAAARVKVMRQVVDTAEVTPA